MSLKIIKKFLLFFIEIGRCRSKGLTGFQKAYFSEPFVVVFTPINNWHDEDLNVLKCPRRGRGACHTLSAQEMVKNEKPVASVLKPRGRGVTWCYCNAAVLILTAVNIIGSAG